MPQAETVWGGRTERFANPTSNAWLNVTYLLEAIQMHVGIGVTDELDLGLLLKQRL